MNEFKSFVFTEEKGTRKLNLSMKKFIAGKIKKFNMNQVSGNPPKGAMIAIPETEDNGGKPLFITVEQFNKIHSRVKK